MRAILYAAKSTKDPKDSIGTQLREGRERATSESWSVVDAYKDENATAFKGDRGPDLARAMAHAERLVKEDGECVLIVQHSDRLARGDGKQARHLVEIALWSIKTDVRILSLGDPQTFENLVMAVIMGDRNSEDSRRKGEAVKKGMVKRASEGLASGGFRPYGYRFAKDRSGLLVVPAEAEIVLNRIFVATLAGGSQLGIARELTAEGIPTVRGAKWRQPTVRQILMNPLYKGYLRYDGEEYPGQHEPIVSEEVWEEAAQMRAARARTSGGGRGRPPKGNFLFRKGMLRCECGAAMVTRTDPNRASAPSETYVCYDHINDPLVCSMPPQKRDEIDEAVFRYFAEVVLDIEATREQLETARSSRLNELRALGEQSKAEVRRVEERLARVRMDYLDGRISAEDWRALRADLDSDLKGANAEVERLATQETHIEALGELLDAEQETLARIAEIRKAIAGKVNDPNGVDAVRGALLRLFDAFVIRRSAAGQKVHLEMARPGLIIEAILREDVVGGLEAPLVFSREPLLDGGPTMNSAENHQINRSDLFGPIPISNQGVAAGATQRGT